MSEGAPLGFGALAARDLRNKYENLCYELRLAQKRVDNDPMNLLWIDQRDKIQRAVDECEKEVKRRAW